MNTTDPFVPWQMLREHVRGRDGKPISTMTLHRWRERGVIRVHNIGGRNYVRLNEALARISGSTESAVHQSQSA